VSCRLAGAADLPAIAGLWARANRARAAESGLPVGPLASAEQSTAARLIGDRIADAGGFALTRESEGVHVALTVVLQSRAEEGAGEPVPGVAHISMLAVHPDHWGAGHGRHILDAACAAAAARGYCSAELWVHADNLRGRRLYEGAGWTRSGRHKVHESGGRIVQYVRPLRAGSPLPGAQPGAAGSRPAVDRPRPAGQETATTPLPPRSPTPSPAPAPPRCRSPRRRT
jgi:ribosomal protein S18 acetylase RimI-like enzyme